MKIWGRAFLLLFMANTICFSANSVTIEDIEKVYPQAMQSAGAPKDFYNAEEIKNFNLTFYKLIGVGTVPDRANMLIPGTQARFILRMLEDKMENNDNQGEAVASEPCPEQIIVESRPITFEHTPIELGPVITEPRELPRDVPRVGSIIETYQAPRAATGFDAEYIQNLRGYNGQAFNPLNHRIYCEDCSPYVASVSLYEPDYMTSQQCSGSLVEFAGKVFLATNRHCIPDDMKDKFERGEAIEDCGSRIIATFAETREAKREIATCNKLVALSPKDPLLQGPPDWALIEVGEVSRGAAKMLARDPIGNEQISLFPMYFDGKGVGDFEIEREQLGPYETREYRRVEARRVTCNQVRTTNIIGSTNCSEDLTKGNSGSGAYINNQFAGILSHVVNHGMSNDEYLAMLREHGKIWAPSFAGTSSRDILQDVYITYRDRPEESPIPIRELERIFPEFK